MIFSLIGLSVTRQFMTIEAEIMTNGGLGRLCEPGYVIKWFEKLQKLAGVLQSTKFVHGALRH